MIAYTATVDAWTLRGWCRAHWLLLVVAVSWCALLGIAVNTDSVARLVAGSLASLGLIAVVWFIAAFSVDLAVEAERDAAAETAMSIRLCATCSEQERRVIEDTKTRIARAIRGRGVHLRRETSPDA